MIPDPFEGIAQVGERINVKPLASSNGTGQLGSGPSPVVVAAKDPVLAFVKGLP
jgi:hypothetical protein